MDYETKITDSMHGGKKLETCITLGASPADIRGDAGERVLVVSTRKGCNGISTFASVCVECKQTGNDGLTYTSRTSAVFEDYSQTIAKAPAGARATLKNLQACHNEALQRLPDIHAACMDRYYPATTSAA